MAEESELDRLDPELKQVKLESGFAVEVVRLRTRQLFRLMRILTKGAGPLLAQLNFGENAEAFGQQLLGILMVAIPEAEQETIVFLQSMCRPAGLIDKPAASLSKSDTKHNDDLFERFNDELFNPELEDLIAVFEVIVENEAPDLQALGKKLQNLWAVAQKAMGTNSAKKKAQAKDSPEDTHDSSTSSATSTAGRTSTSSTSRSAGSGRPRRQRSSDGE